jgi:membrane-associated protease RseP (regulator of RpoE activity)
MKRLINRFKRIPDNVVAAVLFTLTVASMMWAGLSDGLVGALWFAGGLAAILSAHELGHYWTARRYGIPVSLPFFIPMPFSPFGTLGAVIRMKGVPPDRRKLLDVGIAGPLAGLAVIVPAVWFGLKWSTVVAASDAAGSVSLGDSLLFTVLVKWTRGTTPEGSDILLHPLAFAGWTGLLVTSINLLPVGQLDGGHVLYAMLGRRSRRIMPVFLVGLALLCLFYDFGWTLMLAVLVLARRHPPTWDDSVPLDLKRVVLGWMGLALLVVSFTPAPFKMGRGLVGLILHGLK